MPSTALDQATSGKDRPNARDLLASVNSASSGASTSWIAFLGTMAYLAVTLGGISHVDLLLNNETTLPFVNVKVPLTTFFVMAPLAFVLVHFGLLLQHVMLSRKLRAFDDRLWKEQPSRNRSIQNVRDELHSYSFTQSVSGKPKGAAVDIALRLVTSLTLVVFPLLLLTFFQIGFLPYHSEPITWWHRFMLLADVGVVVVLTPHLARRDRATKVRLTDRWHGTSDFKARLIAQWRRKLHSRPVVPSWLSLPARGHDYAHLIAGTVRPALRGMGVNSTVVMRALSPNRVVMSVLVFFSICVATLPDSLLDRAMQRVTSLSVPLPYGQPTNEDCAVPNRIVRCAFWPTALFFEGKVNPASGRSDSVLGWSRNLIVTDKKNLVDEKKASLSLRGRDLRYATLDRSDLKRADFYGAELGGARLAQTDLNAGSFRKASLQGAILYQASLQGAILSGASLQGANLSGASLQGANLQLASLQGAALYQASLQGAALSGASLQGADLRLANLQGADLSAAPAVGHPVLDSWPTRLEGANLSGAKLQGVDLRSTTLLGTNLSGATVWDTPTPAPGTARLSIFFGLKISPLDERARMALRESATILEKAREAAVGHDGLMPESVSRMLAHLGRLLEVGDNNKWREGHELRSWCELAQAPAPDPLRLSAYLGTLSCSDDTPKSYVAQRLIDRVLRTNQGDMRDPAASKPNAFLEVVRKCSAFHRVPNAIKLELERAAHEEREVAHGRAKSGTYVSPAAQPKAPEICATVN